ncbi:MAG: UDP-N-acetylmuramoyl-tripeptide--D-alanyl-D-alanine ligase [Clostridiales bacterium]|nr:UDP-N-acetylmuramoyl-tripeptide--D-alanyl-D-alanine ligase [Clostridiales bacterium]
MKITVGQVLDACKGTLLCGETDTVIHSVCIDSRKVTPGALFVPIKGARSNGHDYIGSVMEAGAAATLTQEHDHAQGQQAWIRVENTQKALQDIAAAYRSWFSIPLVGITGSVGKTTTKEMVALALSAGFRVMKTAGNFNSQIGLPLTLFQLQPEDTAAVIEMGMSDFGEMERLAQIARPQYAVVTNIGISHIENLKTQEHIMAEKLRITDTFTENSVLFLNGDDPLLSTVQKWSPGKLIIYGTSETADYRASQVVVQGRETVYTLTTPTQTRIVTLPALGLHNVLNSLAAVAVSEQLGLELDEILVKLRSYTPPTMRQEIHEVHGITVIDDSYNASPDSIKSGVDVLCSLDHPGRRVAVLADMLELGDIAHLAHFDVGVHVAKAGVEMLVGIGTWAKQMAEGALSVNPAIQIALCKNNQEALDILQKEIREGDCILVKGSRSMKTDEIVKELLQR